MAANNRMKLPAYDDTQDASSSKDSQDGSQLLDPRTLENMIATHKATVRGVLLTVCVLVDGSNHHRHRSKLVAERSRHAFAKLNKKASLLYAAGAKLSRRSTKTTCTSRACP